MITTHIYVSAQVDQVLSVLFRGYLGIAHMSLSGLSAVQRRCPPNKNPSTDPNRLGPRDDPVRWRASGGGRRHVQLVALGCSVEERYILLHHQVFGQI